MRALLDTSVLIALLDTNHVHHALVYRWLPLNNAHGWASCPITVNGCIRILSQPRYPNFLPMDKVVDALRQVMDGPHHAFWADDVNTVTHPALDWGQTTRSAQLTDSYLLALAVAHGGRLVTLDQGIALSSVRTAKPAHLVCLTSLNN